MSAPPPSMDPLLLASACVGSWREMSFLLDRKDGPADAEESLDLLGGVTTGNANNSSLPKQGAASDVEEGAGQTTRGPPVAGLLEGVTVDGDTVLHVLATCGDGDGFLRCAGLVFGKASHLLLAQNRRGDTPLHCAARSGRPKMVSRLMALADGGGSEMIKKVLRKENVCKETALHEAVRLGSKHTVELLMAADPGLANFPRNGASPLYLAVLLEYTDIVRSLYLMSSGDLSYSGSNGQNALHAAVLRNQETTEMLLKWNIELTTQGDQNGSTPLHFATSLLRPEGVQFWIHRPWFPWERGVWNSGMTFDKVLQANAAPMYQTDDQGLFPAHIAACVGADKAVIKFLEKCPNIAGLRDTKGRTFLHVAVENKRWHVVSHACKAPQLSWILNMQDNDGNTALHLAVELGFLDIFCLLLHNLEVHLSMTNYNGLTPLDLSKSKIIRGGFFYSWNQRILIDSALKYCHAKHGNRRLDHFQEQYIKPLDENMESAKLMSSTQTLGLGSVLMATVAFGASFTLPGDYNDDGTPALSGRYAFDAFIAANSWAFACAGLATINLTYSGLNSVDLPLRIWHFDVAMFFASGALSSLVTAYAFGLYATLIPVAYVAAVSICVVSAIITIMHGFLDTLRGRAIATALHARLGSEALVIFARTVFLQGAMVFWPVVTSFIAAELVATHRHK